MDFRVGQIVKAKAGRDKDGFFVIVGLEDAFAYIADGRRRPIDKPKKKKLIHIAPTNHMAQAFTSNREIKCSLRAFRSEN